MSLNDRVDNYDHGLFSYASSIFVLVNDLSSDRR